MLVYQRVSNKTGIFGYFGGPPPHIWTKGQISPEILDVEPGL